MNKIENHEIKLYGLKIILNTPIKEDLYLINKWLSEKETWYLYSIFPDFLNFKCLSELPTYTLIISNKLTNEKFGFVAFRGLDFYNKNGIFDIVLGEKKYRNKGYGFEATLIFLKYIFFDLNMHRVCSYINAFNVNSINSAKKFGFKEEGVLRDKMYYRSKYRDVHVFSILKKEYVNSSLIKWYLERIRKNSK